ncbi:MAG: type VI secretion system-associated protein TagF, partial [Casimicrobiaceae bacterium]
MTMQSLADDPVPSPVFGWFGKLPGAGDFVSRRMSWRAQRYWDQWLSLGLEQLKSISTETGWGVWRNMPAWGFIVPAGQAGEVPQLGLLVPSADRVGRLFPFLVAAPLTTAEMQK